MSNGLTLVVERLEDLLERARCGETAQDEALTTLVACLGHLAPGGCWWPPGLPQAAGLTVGSTIPDAYDGVIARAAERVRERLETLRREQEAAPALLDDLLGEDEARQQFLAHNARRFHTWGLTDLLLTRSRHRLAEKPALASHLAHLGSALAARLDPLRYGHRCLLDTRARALACLADACRALGDFPLAQANLRRAWKLAVAGTLDPYLAADLQRTLARLRRDQGRWEEALTLLEETLGLYTLAQEGHLAGATLIEKATVLVRMGDAPQAVRVLDEGLSLLDPGQDPHLAVQAQELAKLLGFEPAPRPAGASEADQPPQS